MELDNKAEQTAINILHCEIEKLKKAYMAGYDEARKIYCSNLINIDGVKFYDLDLPSGILWSEPIYKSPFEPLSIPYMQTKDLSVPTLEQYAELWDVCFHSLVQRKCVFTNRYGKTYEIPSSGYYWLKNDTPKTDYDYMCFSPKTSNPESCYMGLNRYIILTKKN